MKKLFFSLALVLACVFAAQSQTEYKTAAGARFGYPFSLSLKHFINEKGAVEAFAGYRGYFYLNGFNLGLLYQHHSAISGVDGLKWYVGGGAGVWFWRYKDNYFNSNDYGSTNITVMGCLGLDYKFEEFPINISVDWVPSFLIGDAYYGGFGAGYGALAARYVLK